MRQETRIDISSRFDLTRESTVKGMRRRLPIWVREPALSIHSTIEEKLRAAFAPERLEIINESHLHAGHHHADGGHGETFDGTGETHFRVRIVSGAFEGKGRVERHRAVNAALADQLAPGKVHALAIEPAAPGEPTRW